MRIAGHVCIALSLGFASCAAADTSLYHRAAMSNASSVVLPVKQEGVNRLIETEASSRQDAAYWSLYTRDTFQNELVRAARVGLPLLFEKREGEDAYKIRSQETDDTNRKLTLKSRYLTLLSDQGGDTSKGRGRLPSIEVQVDYDVTTGAYELYRWNVGFFNDRLWLMHEVPENDDEIGTYGVQLKSRW